jgi:hypothetical protein
MRLETSWRRLLTAGAAIVAAAAIGPRGEAQKPAMEPQSTKGDFAAIAEDAYVYGYPLVLTEATRRLMTNVPEPTTTGKIGAPINQFAHVPYMPTPDMKEIVRPNVDTLYSVAWLDLTNGPVVLHVPDTRGRYYVMQMLDAFTNVFAAPGKRTTGTEEHDFAIVGPTWKGSLPSGVVRIQSPTNLAWIVGRTQLNGKADLPACNAIQRQYTLTPLRKLGQAYEPPRNSAVDPTVKDTPPPQVVEAMDGRTFFTTLAQLLQSNPPPARDAEALERFTKIGLRPGQFTPPPDAAGAIAGAPKRAQARIQADVSKIGHAVNGWHLATNLGSYGTRYSDRAAVAWAGFGANLAQDAVYPMVTVDEHGQPLNGAKRYILHFDGGKEPPVNAFWSITLYNQQGYFAPNPINRYAIGDRDKLHRNADGSIDLYIQHQKPSGVLAANWLPAPSGSFNLLLRMYWPKDSVLNGAWEPPPVIPGTRTIGRAAPR